MRTATFPPSSKLAWLVVAAVAATRPAFALPAASQAGAPPLGSVPRCLRGHTIPVTPGNEAETMGKRRGLQLAVLLTLLGGLLAAVAAEAQEELFVANAVANSVVVYSRTANGDIAPLRTLSGGATGLNVPVGLALDLTNNELFVSNTGGNSITVYSRTASGDTAPLRTLSGLATGLSAPRDAAPDLTNNELIVANSGNNSVTVYSRTASGNAVPLRTISGGATGLSLPIGLVLDLTNNESIVTNGGNNSVTVYSRTASGDAVPLRTISGGATGVSNPRGLALDLTNNELFVSNIPTNSVTVYSRTASGDTAPLRTISGAATGLSSPHDFAVTASTPTTTGVISSLNPSTFGQSVTFTATVTGTSPNGTIQFMDGATNLGAAVTMSGGQAIYPTSALTVGSHNITAVYSGDTNNAASTSPVLTQVVNRVPTTTGVTSSLNPSTFGQSVTFTATVTGTSPSGTIQFMDGATNLGTAVTMSGGQAIYPTSALAVGSHNITAVYSGDTNNAPSTSPVLTQVVAAQGTAAAVPTLSGWGLLALALGLAVLGARWLGGHSAV